MSPSTPQSTPDSAQASSQRLLPCHHETRQNDTCLSELSPKRRLRSRFARPRCPLGRRGWLVGGRSIPIAPPQGTDSFSPVRTHPPVDGDRTPSLQGSGGGGVVQINPGDEYSGNSTCEPVAGVRLFFFFEFQGNTQGEERRRPMSNENSPAVRLCLGMVLLGTADQPRSQGQGNGSESTGVRVFALDTCVVQHLNHGNSLTWLGSNNLTLPHVTTNLKSFNLRYDPGLSSDNGSHHQRRPSTAPCCPDADSEFRRRKKHLGPSSAPMGTRWLIPIETSYWWLPRSPPTAPAE